MSNGQGKVFWSCIAAGGASGIASSVVPSRGRLRRIGTRLLPAALSTAVAAMGSSVLASPIGYEISFDAANLRLSGDSVATAANDINAWDGFGLTAPDRITFSFEISQDPSDTQLGTVVENGMLTATTRKLEFSNMQILFDGVAVATDSDPSKINNSLQVQDATAQATNRSDFVGIFYHSDVGIGSGTFDWAAIYFGLPTDDWLNDDLPPHASQLSVVPVSFGARFYDESGMLLTMSAAYPSAPPLVSEIAPSPVPLPAGLALLLTGLGGLAVWGRESRTGSA